MEEPLLRLNGISKRFPGIRALDNVSLSVHSGEVHALIGENGAGKSTLVKILSGVLPPSEGEIYLEGRRVAFRSPHESQLVGISAIHQEATMFPELSVTENIFMGHHLTKRGFIGWGSMEKRTRELLASLDIGIDPRSKVKTLSFAERQMVEIAKALSINTKIVIMDEPTSALTLREVEHLYKIVRQLVADGKAVIFISHKFEEIYEIADSYTVLRDGAWVGEGQVKTSTVDQIVRLMVGRSLDQMYEKTEVAPGPVALKVDHLTRNGVFKDISFELRQGEILGFFGLVGAGRSEVMRVLFGIDRADGGEISIGGTKVAIRNPAEAMRQGIALVPEDRQLQGAILAMNIRENMTLPIISNLAKHRILRREAENEIAERYGSMLQVKSAGWEAPVNSLSGGNQQKVVIAKWLATNPRVLVLDEPTKGIDVGTKATVHKFISELAARKIAVILVSSELPEILGMSDSVIVMHEGRITARISRAEASPEKVMLAATAATAGHGGERSPL
ncbi:MAG: sugar ABC transporter ATP-binding protein [Treponema sp.]|nr:sugar ABC transporter ATP-binding protein [Treponema sp.]